MSPTRVLSKQFPKLGCYTMLWCGSLSWGPGDFALSQAAASSISQTAQDGTAPKGAIAKNMRPGWERYHALVEDNRHSLAFFEKMVQDEESLLKLYEDVLQGRGDVQEFAAELADRLDQPAPSSASLGALLLVVGDARAMSKIETETPDDYDLGHKFRLQYRDLAASPPEQQNWLEKKRLAARDALDKSSDRKVLQKLFRAWLVSAPSLKLIGNDQTKILVAQSWELEAERDLLLRRMWGMLPGVPNEKILKAGLLTSIASDMLDGDACYEIATAALEDSTVLPEIEINEYDRQMRDLGLIALVKLTGVDPKDFQLVEYTIKSDPVFRPDGFVVPPLEIPGAQMGLFYFENNRDREQGLQAWRKWAKANLPDHSPQETEPAK